MIRQDQLSANDLNQLFAHIDRVEQVFRDPTFDMERWRDVIEFLEMVARRVFDSESSPTGKPWPELHPWTVAQKGHSKILIRDYLLVNSMTGQAQHSIREVTGNSLSFGTDRDFAGRHNEGDEGMPQREFSGVNDEDADHIAEIVADALVDIVMQIR